MKINAKNGFDIRFIKNNTYALLVTFKDIEEDLRSAFFTVKENPEDTTPILQKHLGAGISKVDDRAYKKEKKYKVQLQAEDTTPLEADVQYLYDLQVTIGNVVKTVASGLFVVSPTITGDKVITTQEADIEATDELDTEFATVEATKSIEYETDPVANAKIGDMTALATTAKQTVVQAVNEVKNGVDGVKTQVDGILDGTTVVPTSNVAIYASEDTSKGTIEERLTAMGFKQGVAELPDGLTASTNSLTKQGKYVIFNLTTYATVMEYCTSIGIPEDFRPADGTQIVGTYTNYVQDDFTLDFMKGTTYAVVGTFDASTGSFKNFRSLKDGNDYENAGVEHIVNAGWECE